MFTAVYISVIVALNSNLVISFNSNHILRSTRYSSVLRSTNPSEDASPDLIVDLDELARESATEAFKVVPTLNIPVAKEEERKAPRQAEWFPLLLAPDYLDGSLGGDVGFDPIGFSAKPGWLSWMREAEVKHSRLAMLGAIGWPASELWHNRIADALGLESILVDGTKAPSVLNGGLNNNFIYGIFIFTIVSSGILEFIALQKGKSATWEDKDNVNKAGDYGFDPLGLYTIRKTFYLDRITENISREERTRRAKLDMDTAEIKNGRLAMIGLTGIVVQEFIFGNSVVDQTPFFFGDPLQ